MKNKSIVTLIFIMILFKFSYTQPVSIQIDAAQGRKAISPYIYGKNNNISDNPADPTIQTEWKLMREAGLRFTRENGGNNATKYNWRLKISSHPDWYNNIYNHNWDYAARKLLDSLPGAQGMWAFQLIGKAASSTSHNFDDWNYNNSAWWSGVCQNLAGGGVPNANGDCTATTSGNTNLYLENWTADSTVAILDHWFGIGGLGYNKNFIKYWSMDNEPEIWNSTHDDVMPTQPTAEEFMQLYFTVAKKARAKFPNIKLTGPVPASEWLWYTWNNTKISSGGQDYVWLEYFIKRCAEEQTASGIRLLDVVDIHSYPGENNNADIVQGHRIYFDSTYNYPGANGVKTISASGWDDNITQEYIFGRVNNWLNKYMGSNHGVTCAISEFGLTNNNANITANSYASILGTFADNNVEFFTPWYWYPGMWETLHLFSRYGKTTRVQSVSSNEQDVSAYSSINTIGDSITVILVNRGLTATHNTTVNISNFILSNGSYPSKRISSLPSTETFISHTNNALQSGIITSNANSFTVSLPPLSTTAVILKGSYITGINEISSNNLIVSLYPNPAIDNVTIDALQKSILDILNIQGQIILQQTLPQGKSIIDISGFSKGIYIFRLKCNDKTNVSRIVKY
ncbi:MAG: glycoside hydrolase family 44 protein [Bacteroidota bacterium]